MQTTVNDNLKRILKLKGFTLIELEKQFNLSKSYMSRIINTKANFSYDYLLRISKCLDVSTDEIQFGISPERELELIRICNESRLKELIGESRFAEISVDYKAQLLLGIQDIHTHIIKFCKHKNINEKDLASFLDFSIGQFYSFIRYKTYNSLILKSIAKFFNISIESLILGNLDDINPIQQTPIKLSKYDILKISKDFNCYKSLLIIPYIGKNIQEICNEKHISHESLYKAVGISKSIFYAYINDKILFTVYRLFIFAKALGVHEEEIIFRHINLAKNIKIFCILNGVTQQELANSSQVSLSLLNTILTGKHGIPNIIYIKRIANGLNISLIQLIFGVSPEVEEIVFNPVKIGKNIKLIIRKRNITFQQLANLSNLSIRNVSNLINGTHFGIYALRVVSIALNLSIEDIVLYDISVKKELPSDL